MLEIALTLPDATPCRTRSTKGFRWTFAALFCTATLVPYIGYAYITRTGLDLRAELGFGQEILADIFGAFLYGYALALLPSGWLARQFGSQRVLISATLLWATVTLVTGVLSIESLGIAVSSGVVLTASHFLIGVTQACAVPTFARATANWIGRGEHVKTAALVRAVSVLGGAVTPLILHWLVLYWDWPESFFASGALTLIVALSSSRMMTSGAPAQHPAISPLISPMTSASQDDAASLAWLMRIFSSRNTYALCLSQFCFGIAKFVFFSCLYTYLVEQRRISGAYAAQIQTAAYLAMVIGTALGGWLCDRAARQLGTRWGRRSVALIALMLAGTCGILAPGTTDTALAGLVFAMAAGFLYAAAPCFRSAILDVTSRRAGLLGGLHNGAGCLGSAVGRSSAPGVGALLQSCGVACSSDVVMQLAGGMGVLSGLIWLVIDASRPIGATS